MLLRPERTFATFGRADAKLGAAAIVSSALFYSAFSLWLYLAGHQPTFTGNPIPQAQYYLWQAVFLPPWLLAAWGLSASVAYGMSRGFGADHGWQRIATPIAFALSIPLAVSYVLPEMIVFGFIGHDALLAAMWMTGPVTLVWWMILCWKALRAVSDHSATKCALITIIALLTFGFVVAILVR